MNMTRVSTYAKHQTRENVYNKLPISLSNVSPLVGIQANVTHWGLCTIGCFAIENGHVTYIIIKGYITFSLEKSVLLLLTFIASMI